MRHLKSEDLTPLLELTRVRERAAVLKLGQAAAIQNKARQEVEELKSRNPISNSPDHAAVLEKWLVWRDQELRLRQNRLAKYSALYAETSKVCGRVIAEHVVVETLKDQAEEKQKSERETRHLEALNLLSHLLAHDVGDKNI